MYAGAAAEQAEATLKSIREILGAAQ